jgi:hypothetical protein
VANALDESTPRMPPLGTHVVDHDAPALIELA